MATITIGIDPNISLGPVELTWHGLMTAVGIVVALWLAQRRARELGLDSSRVAQVALVMVLAGLVGARGLFLLEHDAAALLSTGEWLGNRGFSLYGGMLGGALAGLVALRSTPRPLVHLDALAAGFPLGLAVGRIGDLINGEHFRPPTDVPWGVRYTHPDALVADGATAFHSGGLYEIVLGVAMLAVLWPLRDRLRRPGQMLAAVFALYGLGRLVMFFWREDSPPFALGLVTSQWISLGFVVAGAAGWLAGRGRAAAPGRARIVPRAAGSKSHAATSFRRARRRRGAPPRRVRRR